MLNKVRSYVLEHNMLSLGDRIVVGVSGGADSICLFDVLIKLSKEYDLSLFVVHVNHGIREEEASIDQGFVEEFCKKHNIAYSSVKKDVVSIAKKEGLSEEEAGRNVRYQAFKDFYIKNKCTKIAVAHNKNDNAETFLFNLFRGSGITGLTGIPPVRDSIIRPLLCLEREEIELYLSEKQIPYRIDSTNLTQDYSRNKIRNKILTYGKEEINNGIIEHISNSTRMLKEIESFILNNVKDAFEKIVYEEEEKYSINTNEFNKLDIVIKKELVREIIKRLTNSLKDIDSTHIEMILDLSDKQVGKSLDLPYGIIALKGYDNIAFGKNYKNKKKEQKRELEPINLQIPGSISLPHSKNIITTKLKEYQKGIEIPKQGYTKWFDYDKIENTVLLRTRQEGDFIQINSKGNRKKLKSLFIDDKIAKENRATVPLITDGSHVIWIIGGRISEKYKLTENTKTILEISMHGGYNDGR